MNYAERHAASEHDALLATKLRVPCPQPSPVPRPRVLRALGDGLARGRVMVCAPAGFGKTTLLADWAASGERPVAWLGLDSGDNDPTRFWRYVVAALDQAVPGLVGRLSPLLGPPSPASSGALVTALINDLATRSEPDDVLLVLDDYHLIDSGRVHESLTFLLDNLPPRLRVVVSSRADPPLRLARLRARGQLAELRAAELRFTPDEATALLTGIAGPGLPGTAVTALTTRTEGWAAGLQLAGLSLRGHPDPARFAAEFSGSHRFVLDYLADEVLDGQPEHLRTFLLETSVLEHLSAELCDAVTGHTGSQALLQEIERLGLFLVPLDETRGWWRYHHLFADLLRARLLAEQPGRARALHRAAADWYERHGSADDAVRHALAAGDTGPAAGLVERNVETLLGRGEGQTLRRWLSELPAEAVRARSRLCLAQAYSAAFGYHLDTLETHLEDAERAFTASPDQPYHDPAGRPVSPLANVPAGIAFLRASLARLRGDARLAADHNHQASEHLRDDDWLMRSLVRWNQALTDWLDGRLQSAEDTLAEVLAERLAADHALRRTSAESRKALHRVEGGAEYFAGFLAMRVCYDLGQVQLARGRLDQASTTYRQALGRSGTSNQPAHTGLAQIGLAQVLYERDDLAGALDHATRGLALCRQLVFTAPLAAGYALVARIRNAHGDPAGALEALDEAGRAGLSPQVVALFHPLPAHRARLLLARGDARTAADRATALVRAPDAVPDYPHEPEYLVLARGLLATNDTGSALGLLERLLTVAARQDRTGSTIEIHALRALALAAQGDRGGALDSLAEAVVLAQPQGCVRVFADEGPPMRALLSELSANPQRRQHRIDPGYLATLVRACGRAGVTPSRGPTAAAAPDRVQPALLDPLTDRELEVLHLLALGRSNQRIARELVVALDTVKKHVTHVLGKLGATNRTEAAARGRQLGLVP
jgi:LuxR family maltose regulon positive regulatory protein